MRKLKRRIQKEVDLTVANGKYTEKLGDVILLSANMAASKRGLYYRYSQFDVDYVIKPRIVDMLLLKVFKYRKDYASAYTFFNLIISSAIKESVTSIRREKRGNSVDLFYIDDIKREVEAIRDMDDEDFYLPYLENEIMLNQN